MEFMTEDFCKKHLYPLLLTLISSIGSVALLCAFFGITSSILWFSLLFPLLLIPVHFLTVNGKPLLFFLIFPLFFGLIAFLFLRTVGSFDVLVAAYTEWWADTPAEQLPPYIFLMLLPAMFCLSLIYLLQQSYVSRLVLAILQLGLLLTLRLLSHNTGKTAVVCFLGYFLFLFLETAFRLSFRSNRSVTSPEQVDQTTTASTQENSDRQNSCMQKAPAYSAQLWPVVLVAMLTLSVLPYGKTPIRWNFVYNVWNTVTSAANDVFQFIRVDLLHFSSDFSLKFSGYDKSGALGGEIITSYTDSIYVHSTRRVTDSVYLVGNTKNIYTGSSWESKLTTPDAFKFYSSSYLDAAELAYATVRAGAYQNHDNIYLSNSYEMRFLDYSSTTMFAAAKTTQIDGIFPGNLSFTTDPDAFRFKSRMRTNTQYRTTFCQPNLGSEEFFALATSSAYAYDNSAKLPSSDLHLFTSDYRKLPRNKELDELFLLRKNSIYENYLTLPVTVPYRVYELAISLTEDKTNDYEKMLALEEYLRGFSYTTSPEELPKDRDLIDYFLFDTKEGYCTYFATALSVLGRCVGIPTRYVQGYCARSTESRNQWTLRSNNAHAWTEAYIDGLGWIPLDATPGYEELRYQPWHLEKEPEPTPRTFEDGPSWWSDMQNEPTQGAPAPIEKKKDTNLLLGMTLLLVSTLALLVLLLLYVLYRKIRLNRFLRTAQAEDRFYYEAAQIFLLTGLLCGNTKAEKLFTGVTLSEFTTTFAEQYSEVEKHAYHFCDDYSKIRYGSHPVTRESCTFALQYKSELMMLLMREKGRYALIIFRIRELFRFH